MAGTPSHDSWGRRKRERRGEQAGAGVSDSSLIRCSLPHRPDRWRDGARRERTSRRSRRCDVRPAGRTLPVTTRMSLGGSTSDNSRHSNDEAPILMTGHPVSVRRNRVGTSASASSPTQSFPYIMVVFAITITLVYFHLLTGGCYPRTNCSYKQLHPF